VILKWEATNRGTSVYRGPYLLDAYRLNGGRLWRINMGINTLADAFIVYDLDGDGKAEIAIKTGDGTVSGTGQVIGDPNADWVGPGPGTGHIIRGPEYLSIFDGRTGAVLATTDYVPTREPIDGWGGIGGNGRNDTIGNRANKFLAAVAYLDGSRPSLVMCRGYFGRSVLVAWDWRDSQLTRRWTFDSGISYPPYTDASPYSGMGNHNLSVADADGDGRHEIIYGAMVVDDDGTGLCTSGGRHGDALHAGDLDPSRPGLEVFGPHENEDATAEFGSPGASMYDARTGEIIFGVGRGVDVGRGVAEDIDPRHPGCENWGGPGGLRDCHGETISATTPASTNFVIWWDGDLTRELLDANHIDKWDWEKSETARLLTASGCSSNNGTKAVPCLTADLFGDWREEAIWRTSDSSELRIYTTTIPATTRFRTLMHDHQYRVSIAWQNVGYNQPPHPSFFLGAGMDPPPQPNIAVVGGPESRKGQQPPRPPRREVR
jgi:rhamnogalacturonan endolyase